MSSRELYYARPEQSVSDIKAKFSQVTGIPVLNKDGMCVGILSTKDITMDVSTASPATHEY